MPPTSDVTINGVKVDTARFPTPEAAAAYELPRAAIGFGGVHASSRREAGLASGAFRAHGRRCGLM